MKIVQLNVTCGVGSTGKICFAVSELLNEMNVENYILYSSGKSDYSKGIKYAKDITVKFSTLSSRVLGNYGFEAYIITKKLIKKLKKIEPDVVHIHNIHSHNCNLKMLFDYIRKCNIKVYWTFHDCWAFTAYCPYFDMACCDRWKIGCDKCPQRKNYSWFFDRSGYLYNKKKTVTKGIDLTVVTPSEWLAGLVKQSYLKDYPVKVINNGIDLGIFRPTESDFRAKYGLESKKIVLGVAFGWGKRKGLDVFIRLAKELEEDYRIVLVGTDDSVDKLLPENIISIHRTQNQAELAEIYTAADIFANPTREEVFGLVNVEALACGTPGVTFNTGGSPECFDEACGSVVEKDDFEAFKSEIIRICETKPYSKEDCLKRAKNFDKNEKFKEYIELYETIK